MNKLFLLLPLVLVLQLSQAQILKRLGKSAQNKVEQKINQKVDKSIDDAVDGKKKPKKENGKSTSEEGAVNEEANGGNNGGGIGNGKTGGLKSYSKFDFVPGEKILVEEDFSQDAVGDFPDKWNTNSTGELVTVEGKTGKWLSLSKEGVFMPEFITSLPENFTLEFDVMCNANFSYYSSAFHLYMAALTNRKEFQNYKAFGPAKKEAVEVWIHPTEAGGSRGHSGFGVWNAGNPDMENASATTQFHSKGNTYVKVSIWRQKQRLRVYLNEEKVWDVPRAFDGVKKYNTLLFMLGGTSDANDRYLLHNVRLAVGAPDTRNKLITEGKFVTHGILFDVNSDRIKPESYGVLKEIAGVLTEHGDVKVKIIGHTDSDGDDVSNMDLSKRRAAAVKAALSKEFNIDLSRMEADGKGESEPADKNDTPTGKANNRRVEFVKL
jgi:outer membrane protein OmpA-like peptidoglycan-associated protein